LTWQDVKAMVLVCQFWDGIPSFRCKVPLHINSVSPTMCSGEVVSVNASGGVRIGSSMSPDYDHVTTPAEHGDVCVMIPNVRGAFRIGKAVIQVE